MPNCNLILDSCCDLPAEMLQRDGIFLLKFPYILDGQSYDDDLYQSTTAKDFYNAMRKGAEPSTSQVSIPVFTEIFTEAIDTGLPTVYLSFTSGLSASYDVALMVRDQVLAEHPGAELYVVDTRLASVAEGLFVYEAMRQWEKGLTAKELADWAEEARYFIDCEFMIEDLDTLRRGGRISGTVAMAGAALDVKPLLTIDRDGKLTLSGMARGRKKGIKQLADYYFKNENNSGPLHTVCIGNADCPKDAERLKELLLKEDENLFIIESSIGPVIGSHVGPGMLAIVFWGRDKRENLSVADRISRKMRGAK